MHILYFVVIPKGDADDSQDAMNFATGFLEDNGFAGDGGLYNGSKADWYEIGGRWSGFFTFLQDWYVEFISKVDKLLKNKYPTLDSGIGGVSYGDKEKEEQKAKAIEEVKSLWAECRPEEYNDVSCPIGRCGTFSWNKSPRSDSDDAVLMTSELWEKLWNKVTPNSYKEVEFVDTEECSEDTLNNCLEEDAINKWWVVIDYHS